MYISGISTFLKISVSFRCNNIRKKCLPQKILMPQHKTRKYRGTNNTTTIQHICWGNIFHWNTNETEMRRLRSRALWPKDTNNPSTNLAACQTVGIGNIQFNLTSLFFLAFLATCRTVVIWNIANSVFKILAVYSQSLSVCVSVWVTPLLFWCCFYIGIAQIALDPPLLCQMG